MKLVSGTGDRIQPLNLEYDSESFRFTPTSWSRGIAFVFGSGGLRFKSLAGQIGHSFANGSPPLKHFFKRSCIVWMQQRGDGPRQLVTRFSVLQRV